MSIRRVMEEESKKSRILTMQRFVSFVDKIRLRLIFDYFILYSLILEVTCGRL
jgi:hypothetical protein